MAGAATPPDHEGERRTRSPLFHPELFGIAASGEGVLLSVPLPARMIGLQSFQLLPGLPQFSAGVVHFVERQPAGTFVWSLQGEPGFNYLIEKSIGSHPPAWNPFRVLTNLTGTVTFTDTNNPAASSVFYRGRILD